MPRAHLFYIEEREASALCSSYCTYALEGALELTAMLLMRVLVHLSNATNVGFSLQIKTPIFRCLQEGA